MEFEHVLTKMFKFWKKMVLWKDNFSLFLRKEFSAVFRLIEAVIIHFATEIEVDTKTRR